ncbi:MAG: S9 family peptidase [Candidatus Heimdallarchaeota archaeon]|nr:S9 family peptidase [Candidatus Heimdallarchaeota archaeon]MCK5158491.1 S9 family peptidase [Candidatus Heimdallarchaeota archaeon]
MKYPETEQKEVVEIIHGKEIKDPYRWLENYEDQKVIDWLDKQNQFTKEKIEKIPNYKKVFEKIKDYLSLGTISVPKEKKGLIFFQKATTESQPILYVQKRKTGEPKILVNPNELSKENPVALDWYFVSPTAKFIVYGLSNNGDEWSLLHIKNVETGEILADKIPRTRFCSFAWLSDESGFYYTRYPEPGTVPKGQENYNKHVFLHIIGNDWHNDEKIFGEGRSPTNHYTISLSEDNKYLLIGVSKYTKFDLYIMDLENNRELTEVIVGDDSITSGSIMDDEIWILTNKDVPKKALYRTKINDPSNDKWQLVIPESGNIISQALITKNNIFLKVMKNATDYVLVYSKNGKLLSELELPEYSSILNMGGAGTISAKDQDSFYFALNNFFYPTTIYNYEIKTQQLSIFKEIKPPLNIDDYIVKQEWYESKDGTKVSMFIVHKKGVELDGTNPTMLNGYGGFNLPIKPPYLKYSRFFWLENNGIIAVANLRGGSEYGEEWHKAGMLEKKQNVFDDFIYAAKWLIKNNYTSQKHLSINGRSNGGLLTGVVVTQEPDLFGAVYVGVPLLDMIRYHLFSIARYWIPEYGSSEDPEQFKYILKYSPYHNVKKGTNFPATYLVAAASDSRVDALHAMKMTALMQWANASQEPILLFVEGQAGHGVGKPLEKLAETETDLYTFLGWKTGLKF